MSLDTLENHNMAKRLKTKARKKLLQSGAVKPKRRSPRPGIARESAPRRNPAGLAELAEFAIPGFGGFAASKFVTRVAAQAIAKRWPKQAKHVGAGTAIATFLSAWFLAHKWKWLAKYQMPVVVGSAIAALQSLIQIYAPNKLGWIVGDPLPTSTAAIAAQQQAMLTAQRQENALPDHLEEISDDPRYYTYNDAYDAGRMTGSSLVPPKSPGVAAPEEPLEDGDEELAQGIFGGGGLSAN